MTLQRWKPFDEAISLRDAIDRPFNRSFVSPENSAADPDSAVPAVDVHETDDGYQMTVSLPGFQADEIDLRVQESTVSLRASRHGGQDKREGGYLLRERHAGTYQRTVTLPHPINADQVDCTFENGVLSVTLPKAEEAKPRRIQIGRREQLSAGAGSSTS